MPMPIPSQVSPASLAALTARVRERHWRPGLAAPSHNEIFASGAEASGAGMALALALDGIAAEAASAPADTSALAEPEDLRAILWVQDRAAVKLSGRPYRHGLPRSLRHRVIHVLAEKPQDALFAMEEGLRCRDLAFVLGEVAGNPRAFDFTASRRLSLTAEKHGVPLWLVRLDARPDLSSARMRWRAAAAPSLHPRWNEAAPGQPAWQAELFRARSHPPGEWILRDDGETLRSDRSDRSGQPAPARDVDLVRGSGDRSLAAG